MALTSIINLNELLAAQNKGKGTGAQAVANATGTSTPVSPLPPIQDSFTPSAAGHSSQAAALEAGLFQIALSPILPAPGTTQAQTNPNPVGAQATSAATITPYAPATTSDLTLPGAASAQPAVSANGQAIPGLSTQNQIQNLNQALVTLGLNHNDILKLDQIATLVNTFSPDAFTDLIGQFKVLAQQSAQRVVTNSGAPGSTNPSSFQVQGVLLHFSAAQKATNAGAGPNGEHVVGQSAPTELQIERAHLTLTSGTGSSVSVLATRTASGASPNQESLP